SRNLTFTSKNSYWKNAKNQLEHESGGKCAYCEADTSVVAHGDVEHFRPKSTYWWLAYCYDNYLFSCQICNQTHKGDRFPIYGTRLESPLPSSLRFDVTKEDLRAIAAMLAPDPLDDSAGIPMATFVQAITKEEAGLPDPYLVDPEPLFSWIADSVLKEVAIAP